MTLECKDCCGNCSCETPDFSQLAGVLETYGKIPGSLITILQKAQDIYGYLSMDAIDYISEKTGIKRLIYMGGYFLYTVQACTHWEKSHHAMQGHGLPR